MVQLFYRYSALSRELKLCHRVLQSGAWCWVGKYIMSRFLDNLKQSSQKIWPHCVCLPKGHLSAWMRPPFPLEIHPQCPCPLYSLGSWTETWCQPPSIIPLTQFWFGSTWMSLYSASLLIVDWEASTGGAYGREHMSLWNYRLFPYA